MLTPRDVTAVIVTKGDVDLRPVLDSLIFPEVVVWDNSKSENLMTYGRVAAARRARTSVIYSQDDDIVHSPESQVQILAAYEPGFLTGCMWEEWSAGAYKQGIPSGYADLVFPGSGSISDLCVWVESIDEYLAEWPYDDFFKLWCDTIIGVISPTRQLDIRFEALEWAEAPDRMANMDDAVALKTEAIRRARLVRDGVVA